MPNELYTEYKRRFYGISDGELVAHYSQYRFMQGKVPVTSHLMPEGMFNQIVLNYLENEEDRKKADANGDIDESEGCAWEATVIRQNLLIGKFIDMDELEYDWKDYIIPEV